MAKKKPNGEPLRGKANKKVVSMLGQYHHRSWVHIEGLAAAMGNKRKGPLEKKVLDLVKMGYIESNSKGQSEYRLTQRGRDSAKQL
jgi:predicted transcriptional regulator